MPAPSRSTPRVVLDTNLVLSSLLFGGGTPGALRQTWQQDRCTPLASSVTATELIRVLAYAKLKLTPAEQEELLADYLPWCTIVQIPKPPPATPKCRDRHDQPFLELALAGNADFLVTGDGDLHDLADEFPCPIVSAAVFLETVGPA